MKTRTCALALAGVLAVSAGGCEDPSPPTLVVHHDGLHWAVLNLTWTVQHTDDSGDWTETCVFSMEFKPGRTFTREFGDLVSLEVEVARLGDGLVVMRETFTSSDFAGADHRLEISITP